MVTSGIGFPQEDIPGYVSPPGREYPYPPSGAQPPVIYDPYQGGFVSPEDYEIQTTGPQPETATKEEDKGEEKEKADLDLGGGQWESPGKAGGLDNPESHELQNVRPPMAR